MTFCDLEPLFYIKLELEREKKNPFDWYNIKHMEIKITRVISFTRLFQEKQIHIYYVQVI